MINLAKNNFFLLIVFLIGINAMQNKAIARFVDTKIGMFDTENVSFTEEKLLDNYLVNLRSEDVDSRKANIFLFKNYSKIKEESRIKGVDSELVGQVAKNFFTISPSGKVSAKRIFWKLNGIVLGSPFPDELIKKVSLLRERVIESLDLSVSEYWELPLQDLHATLVSFSHYDKPYLNWDRDFVMFPKKELPKAVEIISSFSPITLTFDGVVIAPNGAVLLKGFVKNNDLFMLRDRLKTEIDGITQKVPDIVHIKLAQILKPISSEVVERVNNKFHFYNIGEYIFDYVVNCYGQKMNFLRKSCQAEVLQKEH